MPSAKAPPSIYQLKITLLEIHPPIWRRIQVPSTLLLCCLHDALQAVLGWKDSHLHQFEKDGKYWGEPQYYEDEDLDVVADRDVTIGKVLEAEGESLTYVYDFGDNWQHEIMLETIIPTNAILKTPICLDGERRCPPEDVGGASGYEEFLEVIVDPTHEEYEHYLGWAGGHFVDEFDVKAVNTTLGRMRWPRKHKR